MPSKQNYIRVSGSGSDFPGTYARKNSNDHCGRTQKFGTEAGTTTASPFANVTGSNPGASMAPHPSTATRICADLFPESSRTERSSESFASYISTTKYGAATNGARRVLLLICSGAGRRTLPDFTFSLTA